MVTNFTAFHGGTLGNTQAPYAEALARKNAAKLAGGLATPARTHKTLSEVGGQPSQLMQNAMINPQYYADKASQDTLLAGNRQLGQLTRQQRAMGIDPSSGQQQALNSEFRNQLSAQSAGNANAAYRDIVEGNFGRLAQATQIGQADRRLDMQQESMDMQDNIAQQRMDLANKQFGFGQEQYYTGLSREDMREKNMALESKKHAGKVDALGRTTGTAQGAAQGAGNTIAPSPTATAPSRNDLGTYNPTGSAFAPRYGSSAAAAAAGRGFSQHEAGVDLDAYDRSKRESDLRARNVVSLATGGWL